MAKAAAPPPPSATASNNTNTTAAGDDYDPYEFNSEHAAAFREQLMNDRVAAAAGLDRVDNSLSKEERLPTIHPVMDAVRSIAVRWNAMLVNLRSKLM